MWRPFANLLVKLDPQRKLELVHLTEPSILHVFFIPSEFLGDL